MKRNLFAELKEGFESLSKERDMNEQNVDVQEPIVGEAVVAENEQFKDLVIDPKIVNDLMRRRVLQLIRGARTKNDTESRAVRKTKRKAQKKARQVTRAAKRK